MGFVVFFLVSGWFRLVLFLVLIIEVAKWGEWVGWKGVISSDVASLRSLWTRWWFHFLF